MINFLKQVNEIKRGRKYCVYVDFDGTICAIKKNPKKVVVSKKAVNVLKKLGKKARVIILTGRETKFVEKKLRGFQVIGLHGETKPRKPVLLSKLAKTLEKNVRAIKGAFVERKINSVVIHYRNASKTGKRKAQEIASKTSEKGFRKLFGKQVIEFIDEKARNKSSAVKKTLGIPIVFGDDVTDEDAFKKANSMNGISVVVGKKKSSAKYFVNGVGEVISSLNALTNAME